MPRFDIYRNPNPQASHPFFLDIQSDLVSTATRWCIPLRVQQPGKPIVQRAQALLDIDSTGYVIDTPNLLAVPTALLRSSVLRLGASDQAVVEAAIEFMLRGY